MAMPNNLILIRHGHSEGNLVVDAAKQGNEGFYTPDFRERPGHRWRLTEEGRHQAEVTGRWLGDNIAKSFDRYYVSPYVRTRETAGLLGLPDASWRVSQRLRERDWGDIGSSPRSEFRANYPSNALQKEIDSLYWRPPSGESIADVRLRVRSIFDTLHRECEGQSIVLVTHGEFMWAARAELEYMSDEQWLAADKDPKQKIYNTQVLHYSRIDPATGKQSKYLNWRRSLCPWREDSDSGWLEVDRQVFSNTELLDQVNLIDPVVVTND